MESTTLEQAAESLLAPSEETSGGDNLDEAVDAMIEPDDGQSDEVEVADEDQDDVEASDDYDDVEIDDEDLVEAQAEDTNLIPVKVNGKEERWTLDQLKQSASGQAAINQGLQYNAEMRKQLEQQQQQVLHLYQQGQNGGLQAPIAPTRELFESDPIGYMEEKLKFDENKAQYDQNLYQVQQQQAQAQQSYLQGQAEVLKQYIPEIADPEKGEKLKGDIMNAGMDYGFTAEEMAGVSDARYVRALNDARKYRELVAKRKSTQSKGEKARPVVKAGAKKRQEGNAVTRKKAETRLQKTGSDADALSLMFKQ